MNYREIVETIENYMKYISLGDFKSERSFIRLKDIEPDSAYEFGKILESPDDGSNLNEPILETGIAIYLKHIFDHITAGRANKIKLDKAYVCINDGEGYDIINEATKRYNITFLLQHKSIRLA